MNLVEAWLPILLRLMCAESKLLVVTDLDGTLLSESYSWALAQPALDAMRRMGVPLVLNSSKTVMEMQALARELKTDAPIVAENGGLIAVPNHTSEAGEFDVELTGLSRDFILAKAHALRVEAGYQFAGFADWSADEVAQRTGLTLSQAEAAQARYATEPILWEDSEERLLEFQAALAGSDIRILRGGRFLHLMGQADKADGSAAALKYFKKAMPDVVWKLVALGDSANDLAMLEAADIAVVIPRTDGGRIQPKAPRVIYAPYLSSHGWSEAMLKILNEHC